VLFACLGYLMQGVQPLFRQGKWQVTAALTGIALLLYLSAEYLLINFVRGGFSFRSEVAGQMLITAGLTMLFSPVVFWLLFKASEICQHPILQLPDPKNRRKR